MDKIRGKHELHLHLNALDIMKKKRKKTMDALTKKKTQRRLMLDDSLIEIESNLSSDRVPSRAASRRNLSRAKLNTDSSHADIVTFKENDRSALNS